MIDLYKACILGLVEGITEFVPVSSTGHLIIVGNWLSFDSANEATFDIVIQSGAILAVLVLYRKFFISVFSPGNWFKKNMNNIIIAIIPALTAGFFLHSFIKRYLFSSATVTGALFAGGLIMLWVEKIIRPKPDTVELEDITHKQALIIGLCQCFALWPGVSRSGSTIIGGLLGGLDHKTAAKFSFIIAVPVMFAAVAYDLMKSIDLLSARDFYLIAAGFIVSFIVAMGAIVIFMKILQRFKLLPFAVYRIVLSLLLILLV
ncbi:MAG: undecaprenyl-diphosphate phosphatase [bacterium]|nr:undecaprenyl-diphosphate phosphatase [bacterium]